MSIFRAVGWLLGVPPAEQRQLSKISREDYEKTKSNLFYKSRARLDRDSKEIEWFRLHTYVGSLLDSIPKTFIFSNSAYIEKIVFRYIDRAREELLIEFNRPEVKMKYVGNVIVGFEQGEDLLKKVYWKHAEIWKTKKTEEEMIKIAEEIDQEMLIQKQPEINKIEMLEKEKKILELEKEIRELKNSNNRERNR